MEIKSRKLYHFTDRSNIASIKKFGLLAWPRLENSNISYRPGGSLDSHRLDLQKNISDYVHLATSKEHPIASASEYYGRIKDLVWLEINNNILRFRGNIYSDDNALANRATISKDANLALRSPSPQAEVMVKGFLNPRFITNLNYF